MPTDNSANSMDPGSEATDMTTQQAQNGSDNDHLSGDVLDQVAIDAVPASIPASPAPKAVAQTYAQTASVATAEQAETNAQVQRSKDEAGIDLLLEIPLQVSVELGRTRLTVSEILALRVGSVLELNKMAGEPGDVLVNGTLIARGEVVVVDEKFGVRIVEVLPSARRLASAV